MCFFLVLAPSSKQKTDFFTNYVSNDAYLRGLLLRGGVERRRGGEEKGEGLEGPPFRVGIEPPKG